MVIGRRFHSSSRVARGEDPFALGRCGSLSSRWAGGYGLGGTVRRRTDCVPTPSSSFHRYRLANDYDPATYFTEMTDQILSRVDADQLP